MGQSGRDRRPARVGLSKGAAIRHFGYCRLSHLVHALYQMVHGWAKPFDRRPAAARSGRQAGRPGGSALAGYVDLIGPAGRGRATGDMGRDPRACHNVPPGTTTCTNRYQQRQRPDQPGRRPTFRPPFPERREGQLADAAFARCRYALEGRGGEDPDPGVPRRSRLPSPTSRNRAPSSLPVRTRWRVL